METDLEKYKSRGAEYKGMYADLGIYGLDKDLRFFEPNGEEHITYQRMMEKRKGL